MRRRAARASGGRLVVGLLTAFLTLVVSGSPAVAGTINIQLSNFPTWEELSGVQGIPRSASGLSTLQRMDAASRPYLRVENNSTAPLVGFQMDMSDWNAKITSVTWLVPLPTQSTWDWYEASTSAFFQLRDPLLPGDALIVRLGTAAQTGEAGTYTMNQTLFCPGDISCTVCPTGGVVFKLFANTGSGPVTYDNTGKAVGPTISTGVLDLEDYPVTPSRLLSPIGIVEPVTITPVPEPGTVALAASAAAVLAATMIRRRRI
ncbi:MAG: PEP-CTERM sorting domain-containing protein [Planctomycetota bacterium]